jgi:hypothetical protein
LPYECDGDEEETPWSSGASLSGFRTEIAFDDRDTEIEQVSLVATAGYHWGPRWGLSGSVGAILGGSTDVMSAGSDSGDVGAGILASVSGSWLARYEGDRAPFLLLTASIGVSTTTAVADDGESHRLTSGDGRLGVMAGKTFFESQWLVAFATARLFGGPVVWHLAGDTTTGGDTHHYTVGGGLMLRLPKRLTVFIEGMPLGEQSASAGVTASF